MKDVYISVLALGLTGLAFSLLLAFLSKKLKVEEDPRLEEILKILPGINCGACGFSGCRPFAEAAVKEKNIFSGCLPGGGEINNQIAKVLGLDKAITKEKVVVICRCCAKEGEKKISLAASISWIRSLGTIPKSRICPSSLFCRTNASR